MWCSDSIPSPSTIIACDWPNIFWAIFNFSQADAYSSLSFILGSLQEKKIKANEYHENSSIKWPGVRVVLVVATVLYIRKLKRLIFNKINFCSCWIFSRCQSQIGRLNRWLSAYIVNPAYWLFCLCV